MITREHLRTRETDRLITACAWCLPPAESAYLNLVYPLTYGMCSACQTTFVSTPRLALVSPVKERKS